MNVDEYQRMFDLEDTHWWFSGRRCLIERAIETIALPILNARTDVLEILDAGCGTGRNLQMLTRYGHASGLDHAQIAVEFCRKRGLDRVEKASLNDLPLDQRRFDLITLLDVLYHEAVRDDLQALRCVRNTLSPHGLVLITDPAFNWLYSTHDQALGTRRRYTKHTLRTVVQSAGFEIIKLTYTHFNLFPIVAAVRLFKKLRPARSQGSDVKPAPPIINALLTAVLRFEAKLLPFTNFPWGSSLMCIARRTD